MTTRGNGYVCDTTAVNAIRPVVCSADRLGRGCGNFNFQKKKQRPLTQFTIFVGRPYVYPVKRTFFKTTRVLTKIRSRPAKTDRTSCCNVDVRVKSDRFFFYGVSGKADFDRTDDTMNNDTV